MERPKVQKPKANVQKLRVIIKHSRPYNPEFVAKIQESLRQVREGKIFTIALEDLWK